MMNKRRNVPLELTPEDFRKLGHQLIDRIAEHFANIATTPLTKGESPGKIREILGKESFPENGMNPEKLLKETVELIFQHSLFNGQIGRASCRERV